MKAVNIIKIMVNWLMKKTGWIVVSTLHFAYIKLLTLYDSRKYHLMLRGY